MKFRFGNSYDNYINKPNVKTVEAVHLPRRYNGKVLVEFDEDTEAAIINEYKDKAND